MHHATRAGFLAATTAALAVAPRTLGAQTLTKVRAAAIPIDVSGTIYYGLDLGLFKNRGLDLDLTSMSSGAAIAPAVASGAMEIGSSNFISLAQGHERGIPFVMIAPSGAYTSKSPSTQLLVLKSSPLKTAKDLNGKIVAVSSLNNIAQITVSAWVDKFGGEYKSVKFVEVPMSQMGTALTAGRVDAIEVAEPFMSASLAGDGRSLATDGDVIGSLWVQGGYFTTIDYAKSHSDVLKKFSAVIAEAGRWANANPEAATAILQKYSKTEPRKMQFHIVFPERFKPADAQPLIDAAAKYGGLKSSFPSADMMAPEALVQ
jgi:NitT/TauT family transport system substrate-binding protein